MTRRATIGATGTARASPQETIRVQRLTALPGVQFWSVSESQRPWSLVHDRYSAWLLVSPVEGPVLRWRSRGEERSAGNGCVQLMEPEEVHRTWAPDLPITYLAIWWEPDVLRQAAADLGHSGMPHWRTAQITAPPLSTAFVQLATALQARHAPCIETSYRRVTSQLLTMAARDTPHPAPARGHPGVRRAIARLNECFAQAISLADLAREARLSKYYFARCFQEATGLAPHQYRKLLRVQAARRCLERGVAVGEAARRTGFTDGPHLTRSFRESFGISPGKWARAHASVDGAEREPSPPKTTAPLSPRRWGARAQ